jgi:hypothetical protein
MVQTGNCVQRKPAPSRKPGAPWNEIKRCGTDLWSVSWGIGLRPVLGASLLSHPLPQLTAAFAWSTQTSYFDANESRCLVWHAFGFRLATRRL